VTICTHSRPKCEAVGGGQRASSAAAQHEACIRQDKANWSRRRLSLSRPGFESKLAAVIMISVVPISRSAQAISAGLNLPQPQPKPKMEDRVFETHDASEEKYEDSWEESMERISDASVLKNYAMESENTFKQSRFQFGTNAYSLLTELNTEMDLHTTGRSVVGKPRKRDKPVKPSPTGQLLSARGIVVQTLSANEQNWTGLATAAVGVSSLTTASGNGVGMHQPTDARSRNPLKKQRRIVKSKPQQQQQQQQTAASTTTSALAPTATTTTLKSSTRPTRQTQRAQRSSDKTTIHPMGVMIQQLKCEEADDDSSSDVDEPSEHSNSSATGRKRGSYICRRCSVPKAGHDCPFRQKKSEGGKEQAQRSTKWVRGISTQCDLHITKGATAQQGASKVSNECMISSSSSILCKRGSPPRSDSHPMHNACSCTMQCSCIIHHKLIHTYTPTPYTIHSTPHTRSSSLHTPHHTPYALFSLHTRSSSIQDRRCRGGGGSSEGKGEGRGGACKGGERIL
jgi:hypothetical protein